MKSMSKLSKRKSVNEASVPIIKDKSVQKDCQNGYTATAIYLEAVKKRIKQDFYKALECPFLSGSF